MPQGPGLASRSGLVHRPIAGWGALRTRGGHTRQPSLLVPSGLTVAVTHLRDVSGHVSLHQSHTNVAHLNWTLRSPSPGCGAAGRGSHTRQLLRTTGVRPSAAGPPVLASAPLWPPPRPAQAGRWRGRQLHKAQRGVRRSGCGRAWKTWGTVSTFGVRVGSSQTTGVSSLLLEW